MSQTTTERLLRDVHPAEVTIEPHQGAPSFWRDARVFLTDRRLVAFVAKPSGIDRALEIEVAQPCSVPVSRGTLQGRLEIPLGDGSIAYVNAGRGCGCGSPLKALAAPVEWRPVA